MLEVSDQLFREANERLKKALHKGNQVWVQSAQSMFEAAKNLGVEERDK